MLVAQRSHSALSKEIRPSLSAALCHHLPSIPVLPGEHRPPAPGQRQSCILSHLQAPHPPQPPVLVSLPAIPSPVLCISPSFPHHLSPPHFPYLLSSSTWLSSLSSSWFPISPLSWDFLFPVSCPAQSAYPISNHTFSSGLQSYKQLGAGFYNRKCWTI